jgi:hypothetical protein
VITFAAFSLHKAATTGTLSDYYDLRLEGDVGTFGSWQHADAFATKNDTTSTALLMDNSSDSCAAKLPTLITSEMKNWYINIQHQQRFDPTTQLSGNLRFAGGKQYSINSFNPIDALQQQATSTLTLTKTFAEGQRSTTIGYSRNQNLRVTDVSQNITASFYQARLFPFKTRKSTDGVLERIAIDLPNTSFSGTYNNTDSTFSRTLNGALIQP